MKHYGWFLWSLAALFYSYEFIHRMTPGIITNDLRSAFLANDSQLAFIGAFYFYAYAPSQLLSGVLIDRYGVRRILIIASTILTIASFVFSITNTLYIAYISRFFIGLGSAFAFVSCLKIGSQWLATRSFPLVIGLTNLSGTIGALFAGAPLTYFVITLGWREALMQLTLAGLFITILLFLFLRDKKTAKPTTSPPLFKGLLLVIKNPQSWFIAFYGALLVMPIAALPEMWGVEYLEIAYGYPPQQAAAITHTVFIGTALGGPLIGWLMRDIIEETDFMMLSTLGALILLSIFLYWAQLSQIQLHLILFFYGILTANMLLCFDFICRIHPSWAQGAAIGFVNMIIMALGGLGQNVVGWILSQQRMTHAGPSTITDYHLALSLLPFCLLFAIGLTLLMRHNQRDTI